MKIFTHNKKACFQISNDIDIFINETVIKWQSKLELNFCIYWTSNIDYYNKISKKFTDTEKVGDEVAACLSGINVMYLDVTAHQFSFRELEKSIVHELLHLKNPKKSESWIVKKTNQALKK